jgi:hypothetical protein
MPNNKDGHVLNATLMIYNADTFTPEGRKLLATWLRQQAALLVKHGGEYAPRYRARRWSISEDDPTDGGGESVNPSGPLARLDTRDPRHPPKQGVREVDETGLKEEKSYGRMPKAPSKSTQKPKSVASRGARR